MWKWGGPYNTFTDLSTGLTTLNGGLGDLENGDVLRVEANGSNFSVYKNSTLIYTLTDNSYADGNPGAACFVRYGGTLASLGWDSYEAGNL